MANMEGIRYILRIFDQLLKKIGTEKDIISNENYLEIEKNIEYPEDREVIDSVLLELQVINDQIENMRWLNQHYKILHEFAQVCSKTLNEEILLKKAYEMVSQVMSTDAFYMALYNEEKQQIQFLIMLENGKIYPNRTVDMGDTYTSKVIETREIIHLKKEAQAYESKAKFGEKESRSCIFVPVIIDDRVRGVISSQSLSDFAYRKEHEELLQIIGSQVINSIGTARLYKKIFLMSRTDELTGLKNHRAFHEDLTKLMNEKGHEKMTLMMIDSDHLKRINDNFGHDTGDLYLKKLANGIKSVCHDHIVGYRYAGDEFMLIIQSPSDVEAIYNKLLEFYREHPIKISNNEILISVSVGVAMYPEHGRTVDELKKSVDQVLYKAKQQGGNQIVIVNK
ncbi:sensor domain-containing diguanylate cyclase [Cytobacillus dafuensis]|uniref:GGDEF domain-containing protein n=1 Tax=Cytobacillus dafuensis TaxID=1742359 RepID=A0A5B8Z507_CYTDA|nr:GGDEF domain-containing protein [Cytobacillus dafuensis]QED48155.1 GGDEF domain-containing protein [Cytobacillus dafuensis]